MDLQIINSRVDEALAANRRAENIIIYTIGFGAPGSVNTSLLQNCATDPQHYFAAPSAAALQSAFSQIADSLQNLRISK